VLPEEGRDYEEWPDPDIAECTRRRTPWSTLIDDAGCWAQRDSPKRAKPKTRCAMPLLDRVGMPSIAAAVGLYRIDMDQSTGT